MIVTSQKFNGEQVQAQLPAGASFNAYGGQLDSTDEKELVGVGVDDTTLQAAVNAAAAAYVDYDANAQTIRTAAHNALQSNRTYLAINGPTNAQVVAQVAALTRQMNGVIRLLIGELTATN